MTLQKKCWRQLDSNQVISRSLFNNPREGMYFCVIFGHFKVIKSDSPCGLIKASDLPTSWQCMSKASDLLTSWQCMSKASYLLTSWQCTSKASDLPTSWHYTSKVSDLPTSWQCTNKASDLPTDFTCMVLIYRCLV